MIDIVAGIEAAKDTSVNIAVDLAQLITFATHQCDVPVVTELVIRNPTPESFENLRLTLTAAPGIIAARTWPIDRLAAGTEVRIKDRRVPIAGALLADLTERMRADVNLELLQGDRLLATKTHSLTALARNEWGGANHMPELLAAFVTPNDPAVQRLLKEASKLLEMQGFKSSLEGYQAKSRRRSWEILAAIWAAVTARRLTYAQPPASFETQGQKIRTPADIESQGLATCLDTALLFAAAIEQAGLNPLVAFTKGHAFAGAWLQPQTLLGLTTDDPMELRKAVAQRELILFETTLATGPNPIPFNKAMKEAIRQIEEDRETEFVYAIDVKQARGRQITPLPAKGEAIAKEPGGVSGGPNSDPIMPAIDVPSEELPGFDFGLDAGPVPNTPQGRIEHWKRKLLDLSKRNRLLNLKTSMTAIPIFCPDPATLEDKLAGDRKVSLIIPPTRRTREGEPDPELFTLRTGDAFAEQFALEALEKDQIVAQVTEKDLQNGLTQLYRKAKSDLEEGGANTLHLALGMLRWTPQGDTRKYRAPLILVPVKLERRSAASKMQLSHHEDEPVFNLTLLEMLRQEFHIELPELAGVLPSDDNGIDVKRIWEIVRYRVRDVPGFEVVEEVVLSTFSFAKYLMWKDLADRSDVLKRSTFVQHMIDTPRDAYQNSAAFIDPAEVDDKIDLGTLFMPLNADSSQIVAVHASAQGGDFVLEGPPGTGKSETIGNIIAHNLALGRRILFVSEKMAALDVVYRRLKERGLGDFCLELHSNKANKKDVLAQLGQAWDERLKLTAAQWDDKVEVLKDTRNRLNRLVRALHAPGPSGISPRQAIGRTVRFSDLHRIELDWGPLLHGDDRAADKAGLQRLIELAEDLGRQFAQLEPADIQAFTGMRQGDWSFDWQGRITSGAKTLVSCIKELLHAAEQLCTRVQIRSEHRGTKALRVLGSLAAQIPNASRFNLGFGLDPNATENFETLERGLSLLELYRSKRSALSAAYPDSPIPAAPLEVWCLQWRQATQRLWPFSLFGRNAVKKLIATHFGMPAGPNLTEDLVVLAELRDIHIQLEEITRDLPQGWPWNKLNTDIQRAREALTAARSLREATIGLATIGEDISALRDTIRRIFVDGREMLADGMPVSEAGRALSEALKAFGEAEAAFLRDGDLEPAGDRELGTLQALAQAMIDRQPRLNIWCHWMEVRRLAVAQGIGTLVTALEAGSVLPGQAAEALKTAYCAWIAPKLIDERPELRGFSAVKHEDLTLLFRNLDQEVADLTGDYIRAKLSGAVPKKDEKGIPAGFSILNRELQKRMRHKPIRQLVTEMGDTLLTLTPCLMMSPLSVAQFLSADTSNFDIVVFDEASQITVWDAIGAIARGRSVVIVGDPNQMPPSNFFDKAAASDDDGSGYGTEDLESILDEAMSASVRHWRLTGHYRSRHESLIAFSNHAYYDNNLVTYPAAETRETAVSLRRIKGVYAKGKERTNAIEAKAVVAEVVRRLRDPNANTLSIGIVTMNAEQQRLIEDLLDDARRADASIERYFGDAATEPVFVKNLETVQGDQRDVILLSVGYGPTELHAKTMSMNFGPLNRTGGERRLNVAITRATTEMVIFASFDHSMIDLSRTSARAIRDLKHYLDFAERGPIALAEAVVSIGGPESYDSDFEFVVAEGLRHRGWDVRTQIGVSKFRVDLGIVHPDAVGRFLAGVECDGASYHSLPSARDRDRVRHAILERLGWRLIRIWSTDYFLDPSRVLDATHRKLLELLDADRADQADHASTEERESDQSMSLREERVEKDEARESLRTKNIGPDAAMLPVDTSGVLTEFINVTPGASSTRFAHASSLRTDIERPTDTELNAAIDPARFYEPEYVHVLARQAGMLIDGEGPVTFKLLSERIARVHGFQRTGSEIKKVVWGAISRVRRYTQAPDGQKIFWPRGTEPEVAVRFRGLRIGTHERGWADVPYVEKLGLAMAVLAEMRDPVDGAAECARRIGLGRLTAATRKELESLLEAARHRISVV